MSAPNWWLRGIVVCILALTLLGIGTVKLTSQPEFCSSCHEMTSSLASWQSATHNQFNCVTCHNLSTYEKGAMLYTHFTRQNVTLGQKNVQCSNCHRESRVITPSGDLKIPHSLHLAQNIPCGNCHPGAGHLSGQTVNVTTNAAAKYPTEVMAFCLKCHYKREGTLDCRSCHSRPPVTMAHLKSDWGQSHGTAAFEDLKSCNECHKYTLFLNENRPGTTLISLDSPGTYCRDNAFCADCHQQKPSTHSKWFLYEHARYKYNEDTCLVCHRFNYPLPVENAPTLYCQKCHAYRGWIPYPYGDARLLNQPKKGPGN